MTLLRPFNTLLVGIITFYFKVNSNTKTDISLENLASFFGYKVHLGKQIAMAKQNPGNQVNAKQNGQLSVAPLKMVN